MLKANRFRAETMLAAFVTGCGVVVAVAFALARSPNVGPRTRELPRRELGTAYAGSETCRACHPGQYASFRRTYHRTMTQVASPDSVRASFEGVRLDFHGHPVTLARISGRYFSTMPDLEQAAQAVKGGLDLGQTALKTRRQEVVMTTGSHHYQAFWVSGVRGNELRQLPFVYLLDEARFIPRSAAFLQPPDAPEHIARWNSNCVVCHSVAGQPRHAMRGDHFETTVAELGIACEACHGPARDHAERRRSPISRYQQHLSGRPDPTIKNPEALSPERAAAICGQCHAYFVPLKEGVWWHSGYTRDYRPGQPLTRGRRLIRYAERRDVEGLVDAPLNSIFWPDGSVRVGGREYNGLIESACYMRGRGDRKLTCLSCHTMHQGEPEAQLRPELDQDQLCLSCHESAKVRLKEHTHHEPESVGSRCVNCHMPKTSYALFRAIRSHRVDSPTPGQPKPSACTLCHLDRTRAWADHFLRSWVNAAAPDSVFGRGQQPVAAEGPEDVAESVEFLLSGNAVERALWASAMGDRAAQSAAGDGWQAPLLIELLDDPYAVVRRMAFKSLRTLPGFSDYAFDFVESDQTSRIAEARQRWLSQLRASPAQRKAKSLVLRLSSGQLDEKRLRQLEDRRDDTPVMIAE